MTISRACTNGPGRPTARAAGFMMFLFHRVTEACAPAPVRFLTRRPAAGEAALLRGRVRAPGKREEDGEKGRDEQPDNGLVGADLDDAQVLEEEEAPHRRREHG